jgi:hypothetical protein
MKMPIDDIGSKAHFYRDRVFFCGKNMLSKVAFRYLYMIPKLKKIYQDPNYFKFTIIRNPYARIVSAYLGMAAAKGHYNIFIDKKGDKVSFVEFLEILSKNKSIRNNLHFRLQTAHDCWQGLCQLNSVIRLENLTEGMAGINAMFNLNIPIERLYATKKGNPQDENLEYHKMKYSELVSNCISENGEIIYPKYYYFYKQSVKKMVEEIYHRDISLLRYSFDDIK